MKFRSLTEWELELIARGLRLLQSYGTTEAIRGGAKSMLDQKMPENMLWREK